MFFNFSSQIKKINFSKRKFLKNVIIFYIAINKVLHSVYLANYSSLAGHFFLFSKNLYILFYFYIKFKINVRYLECPVYLSVYIVNIFRCDFFSVCFISLYIRLIFTMRQCK